MQRVLDAHTQRLPTQIVAVVEDDGAGFVQVQHGADVLGHRGERTPLILLRITHPQLGRRLQREAGGHVAIESVMGGGLVRHQLEPHVAPHDLRVHLGGVAHQPDAAGDSLGAILLGAT